MIRLIALLFIVTAAQAKDAGDAKAVLHSVAENYVGCVLRAASELTAKTCDQPATIIETAILTCHKESDNLISSTEFWTGTTKGEANESVEAVNTNIRKQLQIIIASNRRADNKCNH